MNPYLSVVPKTPGKFRVGETVFIPHGWGGVRGLVIEDRGIGYQGLRYYVVRAHVNDEPEITLAEDELEPVPNGNG